MFEKEQQLMIELQLKKRGIQNKDVLSIMSKIPRHLFLPVASRSLSYSDLPVPIGHTQTISQPYIIARMLELLDPKPSDKILEIGAGSGYVVALLSKMSNKVIGLELIPELVETAKKSLEEINITNGKVLQGDGSLGSIHHQPFDKIIISAATPQIPKEIIQQLKIGGIIVAPVGDRMKQKLTKYVKLKNGELEVTTYESCIFVPLLGKNGFQKQ